jgi:hypothetical protein
MRTPTKTSAFAFEGVAKTIAAAKPNVAKIVHFFMTTSLRAQ